ncbi:Rab GTPase [Tieghemostelium lacteum]|uniref:Rab GTPase n=1 Tax=Tieghemostelium lacteum TaxID=361077 RepID=A0A151Z462_TIELA|nr:Rab GTPase [Tieghemostelium lacteum]|eukprot:KYQ88749.1 Rab GTPase [Tieghemostelium lacteum]
MNIASYKVLILGASGVGKTSIVKRLTQNKFQVTYNNTISHDFVFREYTVDSTPVRIQYWDVQGDGRFATRPMVYYRHAVLVFVVFDLSKEETYTEAKYHIKDLLTKYNTNEVPSIYLIGNKSDLVQDSKINDQEVSEYVENNKFLKYGKVSCKLNIGLEMFNSVPEDCVHFQKQHSLPPTPTPIIETHSSTLIMQTITDNNLPVYKLCINGPPKSGKTSLFVRHFKDKFNTSNHIYNGTLATEMLPREYTIDGKTFKVQFWDYVLGCERLIPKIYFRRCDAVILIFDLSNVNSYNETKKLYIDLQAIYKELKLDPIYYLFGNKLDLEQDILIQDEEVHSFAQSNNMKYFKVSCLTGEGFNQLDEIPKVLKSRDPQPLPIKQTTLNQNQNHNTCCFGI